MLYFYNDWLMQTMWNITIKYKNIKYKNIKYKNIKNKKIWNMKMISYC